jgi:hypothetical protein
MRKRAILSMSRRDKALRRFLSKPTDFRFDEMSRLLKDLGYEEIRSGKTSGSRVAYLNKLSGHIIRLHRPHPGNIVKRYQMELIEDALRAKGSIE